jgi:hypothetical protein
MTIEQRTFKQNGYQCTELEDKRLRTKRILSPIDALHLRGVSPTREDLEWLSDKGCTYNIHGGATPSETVIIRTKHDANLPMDAPIEVFMGLFLMGPDRKVRRTTITMPPGVYPTRQALRAIFGEMQEQLDNGNLGTPEGTRLPSKFEFWSHLTAKHVEGGLPMTGNPEFENYVPREKFESPMFGPTEIADSDEAAVIEQFIDEIPTSVFQALGKRLNAMGFLLSIDAMPAGEAGAPVIPPTRVN